MRITKLPGEEAGAWALSHCRRKRPCHLSKCVFSSSWPLKWISICFSKENSCLLGLIGNTNSNKLSIHCSRTCLPVFRECKDSTRCSLVWFSSQGLVTGGVRGKKPGTLRWRKLSVLAWRMMFLFLIDQLSPGTVWFLGIIAMSQTKFLT